MNFSSLCLIASIALVLTINVNSQETDDQVSESLDIDSITEQLDTVKEQMDNDKNGEISKEEFLKMPTDSEEALRALALSKRGDAKANEESRREQMDDSDSSKDASDEIAPSKEISKSWHEELFAQLDQDNNGSLTMGELQDSFKEQIPDEDLESEDTTQSTQVPPSRIVIPPQPTNNP